VGVTVGGGREQQRKVIAPDATAWKLSPTETDR